MRLADEISIAAVASPADAEPTSELRLNGRPMGRPVSGAILEAAVSIADEYLLFLTDDVPYEDVLSIHLVDRHGELRDSARLGAMYATGSFAGLALEEPNAVRFGFIGDTDWTVQVLARPQLIMPWVSEPTGVSRPLGFAKRRFRLQGRSRPKA